MRRTFLLVFLLFLPIYVFPELPQACGAAYWQKPDDGTPDTNQVVCPSDGFSGVCLISVSFLKCLSKLSPHPAIRINPDDLVTWYSDQKDSSKNLYKIKFDSEFKQKGSQDYKYCKDMSSSGGDPAPFPGVSRRAADALHAQIPAVAQNGTLKPGTCFEPLITLRDSNNYKVSIDPHVIIGDGTIFYPDRKDRDKHKQ